MRDVTKRHYVFTTFNNFDPESNKLRYDTLLASLQGNGRNAISVLGRYEGQDELSILLTGDNNFEDIVKDICLTHKQESYLVVYPAQNNYAELVFLSTGQRKALGTWQEVTEEQALASNNFTRIVNKFYIVKG